MTNNIRILCILWSSWLPPLREAAQALSLDLTAYTTQDLARYPSLRETVQADLSTADIVLLYRTADPFWEEWKGMWSQLTARNAVVVNSVGELDPAGSKDAYLVYRYLLMGGRENMGSMIRYLIHRFIDPAITYEPPQELPWQGIYHPQIDRVFDDPHAYLNRYRAECGFTPIATVGLLYSRTDWVVGNLAIPQALITALERRHIAVIPVFFYPLKDANLGNLGGTEVIERYFLVEGKSLVDGIVRLTSFPLSAAQGDTGRITGEGERLLRRIGRPLFCPVICYSQTEDEWWHSEEGLGSQASWSLSMPEFEGAIEPLIVGARHEHDETYVAIQERVSHFAARVSRWLTLQRIPPKARKVAFILHNNPCASAEASIGAGAHLDTAQSVVAVLKRMAEEGYRVTPPDDGQALIRMITERHAMSEFRWTTVEDIVAGQGAVALVNSETYTGWWQALPEEARHRMVETWGPPPGTAMVYNGNIVITGLKLGNAIVCVQPKRGCAGTRCDGQACKILHDPLCPPTHQYAATYWWLAREFRADVIVHVGTHGNLEFLPGKGTGLSAKCFPDMGIDDLPHLYIYNADNPAEGTTAKRRTYATIIDHMQTVMASGGLYGDWERLDRLISEYYAFHGADPGRAQVIAHMIASLAGELHLLRNASVTHEDIMSLREQLEAMKSTSLPEGMHILGTHPEGEHLVDFVYAILRYDSGPESLRGLIRRWGVGGGSDSEVEKHAHEACRKYLLEGQQLRHILRVDEDGRGRDTAANLEARIRDLTERIRASDEIGALLTGIQGRYVAPGPSGLITRGHDEVLPTGRNFYSFDPRLIPSPSAWETGKCLAEKTVARYREETGRWPENISFYWQCTDLMWAQGEGLSQMLYLLGVRPQWGNGGQVTSMEVLPLEELGRPRIDITVRVSGITRDNFPSAIAFLDEAIERVASLDEPPDRNFVRKHTQEKLGGKADAGTEAWRRATFRIFSSMPGTYQAGTQLAVYASAWQTEQDLADVFLYWNGYAYGREVKGESAHRELASSLTTVELSFNRTVTDEYDLTGCCSTFGVHGGMINTVRVLSGRQDTKHYYGDTRDPDKVVIRTLQEEIRRVTRAKILHPRWIEGMKKHGYQGAGEIMKRVGRLYGWQATTKSVDASIFDDIARTFVMDKENREFFSTHNPWALEEMARRLLEAKERGLWQPAPDVDEALQEYYLEIEGYVEENITGDGDRQGGSIDIVTSDEIKRWKEKMNEVKS